MGAPEDFDLIFRLTYGWRVQSGVIMLDLMAVKIPQGGRPEFVRARARLTASLQSGDPAEQRRALAAFSDAWALERFTMWERHALSTILGDIDTALLHAERREPR